MARGRDDKLATELRNHCSSQYSTESILQGTNAPRAEYLALMHTKCKTDPTAHKSQKELEISRERSRTLLIRRVAKIRCRRISIIQMKPSAGHKINLKKCETGPPLREAIKQVMT